MTWTIVLAGGSGTRLAEHARHRYGYARPKQFCDFDGSGTLLDRTIARARRISDPEQIVVVTTRSHRPEASEALRNHPGVVHVEQPCSRDTTPGVLLPFLHVLARNPSDQVVLMPADHHVANEDVFAQAMSQSLALVRDEPQRIAILGAEPAGAIDDYGWLVTDHRDGRSCPAVQRFKEKPEPAELAALRERGALVNTFVLAARAWTLAAVFASRTPGWWRALINARHCSARLEATYDVLPASNFSRDILEGVPHMLRVVPLRAEAGWTDVGTSKRFASAFGTARLPRAQTAMNRQVA